MWLQLEEAGLETEEDEDMESKGIDLRLANVENLLFNFRSYFEAIYRYLFFTSYWHFQANNPAKKFELSANLSKNATKRPKNG